MTEDLTNEISDKALIRRSYHIVSILVINIIIWVGIGLILLVVLGLLSGIVGIFGIEILFGQSEIYLPIMMIAQISTAILAIFLLIREGTEIIRIVWKEKTI